MKDKVKKWKLKATLLFICFIAAGAVTYIMTRKAEEPVVTTMQASTLPIIYMQTNNGVAYNTLHGYTGTVNQKLIHDAITPLPEDRRLKIYINEYTSKITSASYEIRSIDTNNLIEQTDITDLKKADDIIETELNIKNLLDKDTEYMLKINIITEEKEASYYTRIILSDNLDIEGKLDYILYFNGVTFDSDRISEIIPKLEPNSTGDNTNLGRVNIHSKLSQVGYGSLKPSIASNLAITLTEIKGVNASVELQYQAKSTQTDGRTNLYNIKEYYRIRQGTEGKTYVLGFDRWMDQVFDTTGSLVSSGKIYLGIESDTPKAPS